MLAEMVLSVLLASFLFWSVSWLDYLHFLWLYKSHNIPFYFVKYSRLFPSTSKSNFLFSDGFSISHL